MNSITEYTDEHLCFQEMVDINNLENMVSATYDFSGMPIGVIDAVSGELCVAAGWQNVCLEFERGNMNSRKLCVQSEMEIAEAARRGESTRFKCKTGFRHIGIPVFCRDRHVASIYLGEFLYDYESEDMNHHREYAIKCGYDVDEYLNVVKEVPAFSEERVDSIESYNRNLALFLSNLAGRDVDLRRELEQRKQAEEALRGREASLASVFKAAPVGIGVVTDRMLTQVNERLVEMTGFSEEEMLGNSARMLYPSEEDYEYVGREKYRQIKENGTGSVETCWKCKDESKIDIILSSTPIDTDNWGKGVTFTALDITQRKKAEAQLNQFRRHLSDIIDSMPSVIIGVDVDCNVTLWNRSAQEKTGINSEHAVGRSISDVTPWISDEFERVKTAIESGREQVDLRRSRQSGRDTIYEDVVIFPLRHDVDGGAVIRIDDVTERISLEQMMVQSEKMLTVGGLAAGMAHEINNPLAAILGCVQIINGRLFDDKKRDDSLVENLNLEYENLRSFIERSGIENMLQGIHESGVRAARIVNNMLSFSRMGNVNKEYCILKDLLESAVELASSDYNLDDGSDFRKIRINREYDQAVPPVKCNRSEVQQVFLNLLKNGADAMEEKKYSDEAPCFTLRLRLDDDMVVVEIEDNGCGMDESIRKRIFDPFFTTKQVGKGTGLGLSVSYFIITENHGGKIEVSSIPESMTRFVLSFPAPDVSL